MPSLEVIKRGIANPVLGQMVRLLGVTSALFLSDFPRGKMVESRHTKISTNVKSSNIQGKDKRWLCVLHMKNKRKQKN